MRHFDPDGGAVTADVPEKEKTARTATAGGKIKPCPRYDEAVSIKGLFNAENEEKEREDLKRAIERAVESKPRAHCFGSPGAAAKRKMSCIGG